MKSKHKNWQGDKLCSLTPSLLYYNSLHGSSVQLWKRQYLPWYNPENCNTSPPRWTAMKTIWNLRQAQGTIVLTITSSYGKILADAI